jgi:hypothetical protein
MFTKTKYIHFPDIVMSWLYCPGCLSGRLVQSDLSLLSRTSYPVSDVLSKMSYPDQSVLSRLNCPSCPAQATLSTALLTPLSFPDSPVISVFSTLTFQVDLSVHQLRFFCPNCPAPTFLSRLSCPGCHVPAVLSKLFCPMSCPRCPLSIGTVVPSRLSCLSWMSCPRYHLSNTMVVPSQLSCLSCPALAVIFWSFRQSVLSHLSF